MSAPRQRPRADVLADLGHHLLLGPREVLPRRRLREPEFVGDVLDADVGALVVVAGVGRQRQHLQLAVGQRLHDAGEREVFLAVQLVEGDVPHEFGVVAGALQRVHDGREVVVAVEVQRPVLPAGADGGARAVVDAVVGEPLRDAVPLVAVVGDRDEHAVAGKRGEDFDVEDGVGGGEVVEEPLDGRSRTAEFDDALALGGAPGQRGDAAHRHVGVVGADVALGLAAVSHPERDFSHHAVEGRRGIYV